MSRSTTPGTGADPRLLPADGRPGDRERPHVWGRPAPGFAALAVQPIVRAYVAAPWDRRPDWLTALCVRYRLRSDLYASAGRRSNTCMSTYASPSSRRATSRGARALDVVRLASI